MPITLGMKYISFLQAEGQTALHIASLNGDENMIRTLYLARANATLVDAEGMISKTYYCRH